MAVRSKPMATRTPRASSLNSLLTASVYALALAALLVVLQQTVAVGQRLLDDLHYGRPRTIHLAGTIGGGDGVATPTRFLAINLEGQISVLVLPAGDPARLTTLPGPYVVGRDGRDAVPLLGLRDVNGDGAADLELTIRGESIIYVNREGTFGLITPEERAQLE